MRLRVDSLLDVPEAVRYHEEVTVAALPQPGNGLVIDDDERTVVHVAVVANPKRGIDAYVRVR